MDTAREILKKLGYLWYIIDPMDNMFDKVENVPDYYKEITPAYIFLIIIEQAARLFQGKGNFRINDTVTNISQGILMELSKIPMRGIELLVYTWVYNNWRLYTLPWNSLWTWLLCMVASDFCFYWAHRALHQINLLWAFHETHHSSEDFNLTTPLRLSVFHEFSLWFTYVPLALAVPPSIYLVHFQLGIIYQFWLHTEVVGSLGVLEYVFVTPSHHRVHHGRNHRCIDKNFGSIFIVWDKLFGTFEPEGEEAIVYGITTPLQTFNPLVVQFNHLQNLWRRVKVSESLSNKLACIFRGPGWSPGKPWLGYIEDIPEPEENEPKYDRKLPWWLKIYVVLHTVALVVGHFLTIFNISDISTFLFSICGSYLVLTTISLGCLLDLRTSAPLLELSRCFLYILLDAAIVKEFRKSYSALYIILYFFRCLSFVSLTFWLWFSLFVVTFTNFRKHF